MSRYITLIRFTSKGVTAIRKSPARAAAFRKACRQAGVTVEAQYWTAGRYDGALIVSGLTDRKVLQTIARLASQGNVTTETLQAFDAQEFKRIVG